MANALPAWLYPVSQAFGGGALGFSEKGTDYATPFHTPVPAPFAGTVIGESYGPYGGEIDIALSQGPGGLKTETLLHLDQILVAKGQTIEQGQEVGLSGGQNVGGSHPATPQYSTGPHTEIDLWKGSPWSSPSVNPDPILKALGMSVFGDVAQSRTPSSPSPSGPTLFELVPPGFGVAQLLANALPGQAGAVAQQIGSTPTPAFPNIINVLPNPTAGIGDAVTKAGHGIADFFAVSIEDIGIFLKRQIVALAVAAVVLLILFA